MYNWKVDMKTVAPPNFVLLEGQSLNGFEDILNAILSSIPSDFKIEIGKVKITSAIRPMLVNFIFEEFTDPETLNSLNSYQATSGKRVLVFTEFVTKTIFGNTFNAFNLKDKMLISKEEKTLYLRRRFKSALKVLQNFKFDAVISMHPEINQNLSKLLKNTINHDTNIISFYPLIPMYPDQTLTQDIIQKLQSELDIEYYSRKYSEDLKLMPDETPLWHFLRYGKLENRVRSNFLENNVLDFQEKQRDINSGPFLGETLKIFSSGSSNNHRKATIKSVEESFGSLSPLGFTGSVEIESGWNNISYDLKQILNGGGYSFSENGARGIDLIVPQSPEWSFLSPVRIWRSFCCGLVPIYFTKHFDSHPLSAIVEQVRSTYPIYTLAEAIKNRDFLIYFSKKVEEYNKLASTLNEDFFDVFR